MQRIRDSSKYYRLLFYIQSLAQRCSSTKNLSYATLDPMDFYHNDLFQKQRDKVRNRFKNYYSLRYFVENESNKDINIDSMNCEDIELVLQDLLSNNRDGHIIKIIKNCLEQRKLLSDDMLKKLFRYYSVLGKKEAVEYLQKYCFTLNPNLYRRNGEFLHYIAKAQCMKGNSEKGLSILKEAYTKYQGLRSFYRIVFSELINDSVQNRSEASIMIFRKYVLEFSNNWNDHYPLICFWHICWSSTWFSDQMIAENLLDSSPVLQGIVQEKATIFCINILKDYNDDAVIRLLQSLIKYDMKVEYGKVLQILFGYKLKNRDLRGCTEILRNSETLGINISANQQGRYIKMLINKQSSVKTEDKKKTETINFKLKF